MNILAIKFNTPSFKKKIKYDLIPKNELIDLLQKGYTQKDLAVRFNVPQHVITRTIKIYKIFPNKIKHAERRINTLNHPLK